MGQIFSCIIPCIRGDELEVEERVVHQLLPPSSSASKSIPDAVCFNQLEPIEGLVQQLLPPSSPTLVQNNNVTTYDTLRQKPTTFLPPQIQNMSLCSSNNIINFIGASNTTSVGEVPPHTSKPSSRIGAFFRAGVIASKLQDILQEDCSLNSSHTSSLYERAIAPNSHPYSEWDCFDEAIPTTIHLQNSVIPFKKEHLKYSYLSNNIRSNKPLGLLDDSQLSRGDLQETELSKSHQRSKKSKKARPKGKVQEEVERPVCMPIVVKVKEKRIKHYTCNQKILLVGEGDFSFSACLAEAFGSAVNMVATSLDSIEFLTKNYRSALKNIEKLQMRGSEVFHGVDATKIGNKNSMFKGFIFDRIIFNFPHAGFSKRNEPCEVQIRDHQKLVRQFLKNAKKLIADKGEIHISHKTNNFHRQWSLDELGSAVGLKLLGTSQFKLTDYPSYNTKYGFGSDRNFNCNPSKTFKFGL